ncbi:MAG: SAM-dependent chlorinase/fluorinase [Planctomycetes bacterium]|nr:SAM-dependent chlorinase/fluorinase [Planctomycetota bacterium]
MASRPRVIALVTDFGTRDPYVGVMKGVALGIAPRATLVDLTHEVPPQDVAAGRRALADSARYFPAGTVFVAIVDPGVGTARRALAARSGGRFYLAPDNGLLAFLAGTRAEFRAIDADRWGLEPRSATFHGRDVFAPAAARLAAGLSFARLGPRVAAIAPGPPAPAVRRRRGGRLEG